MTLEAEIFVGVIVVVVYAIAVYFIVKMLFKDNTPESLTDIKDNQKLKM